MRPRRAVQSRAVIAMTYHALGLTVAELGAKATPSFYVTGAAIVLGVLASAVPVTHVLGRWWSLKSGAAPNVAKGMRADAKAGKEARARFLVLSTLAWVTWAVSFIAALLVTYHYLAQGPQLLVHLGAVSVASLFAECFMISAFVACVDPPEQEEPAQGRGSGRGRGFGAEAASATVIVLGTFLAILGGALVSVVEYLPDAKSKLVYTCLAGCSVLIGVMKTHGLGGWVRHHRHRRHDQRASQPPRHPPGPQSPPASEGRDGGNATATTAANASRRIARGRVAEADEWCFWQPGRGGTVFIIAQFIGWLLFTLSLLGTLSVLRVALQSLAHWCVAMPRVDLPPWIPLPAVPMPAVLCLPQSLQGLPLGVWTAAIMVAAQLMLAGSLTLFKGKKSKGKREEGREGRGRHGVATPMPGAREACEDWMLLVLLYCPHYLLCSSIVVCMGALPPRVSVALLLGAALPLYLFTSLGQPHRTGCREWPAFQRWIRPRLCRITQRLLGGAVRYLGEPWPESEAESKDSGAGQESVQENARGGVRRPTKRKFIFAYHPHALYPIGVLMFKLLPGFEDALPPSVPKPVTLVASVIFRIPVLRDLACWAGCREVSRSVFCQALEERGVVALIPGGQGELCEAPRAHLPIHLSPEVVLNAKHKGFVRIALETGASLVPVVCFGEIFQLTNLLDFPRVHTMQAWTYKTFGFPVPFLPSGRVPGVPLPLAARGGLAFVVGRPLPVARYEGEGPVPQPLIDATHQAYYQAVKNLYDKHAPRFPDYAEVPLRLRA